ncbi:carboxypeptidase regulatory-like domain-containing protein [Calycomorphotria hydatis]|uniref:Carboxypeptidase regulatory-like domain-containing protein n=1 Tax=Calycomorphotria hydatis TaxID=2528027 RepID=A0A517TE91_9PLAN|nr:carboxypeptidase regulatory-like domain-containing protein [Calycomorphotria hydatis]QDT66687.1 hypothetical protein V22_39580 [Calycomorphotria hydatis]
MKMTFSPNFYRTFFAVLSVCFLAGCFGKSVELPELAEVHGTVSIQGKPAKLIMVVFQPEAGGVASRGTTDADGKYSLRYGANGTGALFGKHQVRFSIADPEGNSTELPEKYSLDDASISVEVTSESPNEFDFELSD